jgi:hypothetical protein
MRSRLLAAVVATALAASLAGPTAVAADPREVPRPPFPDTASKAAAERAGDTLARATALLAEKSPAAARRQAVTKARDATLVLRDLRLAMDDLPPAEQKRARALLARPTELGGDGTVDYQPDEETPVCSTDPGTPICVHYVATSDDAPPATDTNPANGIPDEVERALATTESVHRAYVNAGYRRPDPDGTKGTGNNKVDIYLADIGDQGLYGYCTSDVESPTTFNLPAYCVIDDDYSPVDFPTNTPSENQQVTLAHEYYHAVQFAYDAFEDGWIMEATATWAEEQLYDEINDNRQYLKDSQISAPWSPLDRWSGAPNDFYQYGNWVFFEYLTQRWRAKTGTMPTLVLDIWKRLNARAGAPDRHSTRAVQEVLSQRGASFTAVYGQFVDGNRRPAKTYPEGKAATYKPARPAKTWTLSKSKRGTGGWYYLVDHLTSVPIRIKPASGLRQRDWKLRVSVDLPPAKTAPVARVSVYLKSGKVATSNIRLKAKGLSSKAVGFSSRKVKYVELVMVNASLRTRCWTNQASPFACLGTPRDDAKKYIYNASIFRS